MNNARVICLLLTLCAAVTVHAAEHDTAALQRSIEELRSSIGKWRVITKFLNDDGSTARAVSGSYEFDWVIEDQLVSGNNSMPELQQSSAILFYIRDDDGDSNDAIEMVSVGADGRLWVMTGELGGDTRYTQVLETPAGGHLQLRFTRYNVTPDSFESRMERSTDGGLSWRPGNHQLFKRDDDPQAAGKLAADDKSGQL